MARTAEYQTAQRTPAKGVRGRVRVVVRRVEPWSVLRFSLLFYFCIMLIFLFGMAILYWALGALGVLESLASFIGGLYGDDNFEFHGGWIFTWLFVLGIVGTVAWSLINVCVAFLYNLVSDIVGGVQITLDDRSR
ncbi:MAG: DUF3566 domain-containing protein [Actinobacteria bacterium]|nr:DUF3566 domain-containing protein [Actinomycetota bacterium]